MSNLPSGIKEAVCYECKEQTVMLTTSSVCVACQHQLDKDRIRHGHEGTLAMVGLFLPFIATPINIWQPTGFYVWVGIVILWMAVIVIGVIIITIHDIYHDSGGMI